MASMVEELISVLKEELEIYQNFIPICKDKTTAIVKNDVEKVSLITNTEQEYLDRIASLEKKRTSITKSIADVTGKKYEELTLATIIKMIDKQPNEQKILSEIHDNLKTTTRMLVDINNHNTSLIKQSLEMIEFNMNFIQSTWMSPGNNNYDRGAGTTYGENSRALFDAKQ